MKSKESPNLYEILKTTSGARKAGNPLPVPQPIQTKVLEEPRKNGPLIEPPRSVVSPRPVSTPVLPQGEHPGGEPGEKTIRFSYNTAIFLVLSGIGLLFIAYALGVRSGRSRAMAEVPTRPIAEEKIVYEEETAPPLLDSGGILAPVPEKLLTIKLLEWSGQTARDRVKAQQNAERIKKSLTQNGLPASYYQLVTRKDKRFVVLRYGKYEEEESSDARKMLGKLRQFKYRGTAYFSRAGIETIDKD
jgi:hypothetical protein